MSIPFVDLRAQYDSIKPQMDAAINEILNATSFIGGKHVSDFEKNFAEYIGVKNCVGCANGTDSMEIILKAMNIGSGDEVIVPANSWISTAEVVNGVGAEPIFVDVNESDFNINSDLIPEAITTKTKAIIPVHLFGQPANMNAILGVAKKHNLRVIEDCAQAHGASINGRKVGTFGDAASFSFYPGKNLGAYGDAGAMLTDDLGLAEQLRRIGNHGQLKKHDHKLIGRNSRLDTIQATILNVKIPHLNNWIKARNGVAHQYLALISENVKTPITLSGNYHAYHLFVLRTHKREALIEAFKDAKIGHGIHYPTPLPFVEAYAYKGHKVGDFPVAELLAKEIVSIPIFPEMKETQVRKVTEVINSIV